MAEITGTAEADILTGTASADILMPLGTPSISEWDVVRGLNGADIYDLTRLGGGAVMNFIIDDRGTDGAVDRILNAGALYHSASLGYSEWASVERVGSDLVIQLPGDPDRFHDPGSPPYQITIVDHFAGSPVEFIECAGVTYALPATGTGTMAEDIIAGSALRDVQQGLGGDDYLFGNGGDDILLLGDGNDTAFGGTGRDIILGGAGDDWVEDADGDDIHLLGDGQNHAEGGAGNDLLLAGAGFDWLEGGDGNDRIIGGAGQDMLDGGYGDDLMIGGAEGDLYRFGLTGIDSYGGWGHDVIRELGNAPSYLNEDIIELYGFYGPSSGDSAEAYARVSFARVGDDMVISADGGSSTITVANAFALPANLNAIEALEFNGAYWEPLVFEIVNGEVTDLGSDRDHGTYGSELNEVMFGTEAGEEVFGGAGNNFIWLGGGADTLIYKLEDGANLGGLGGSWSHDIVEDFDVTEDKMDFTETGLSFADLAIGEDANGDALITWYTPDWEIADIAIELRGVAAADVTEDLFLF